MQVSPVDLQAWAEATGNPYPTTAAEKAAVMPAVIAWKQGQEAAARENRGQNTLAAPLAIAAGAGLGLAGLAAFRALRRDGLSEPAAAQKAAEIEREVRDVAAQATSTAVADPPAGPFRAPGGREQMVRKRNDNYQGPRLRGDDESGPTAAEYGQRGGELAREQGQYKARTDKGFHNPAVAALNTPEKREAYLAAIAEEKGAGSREFRDAQGLIASLETTTGGGVDPLDFLAGKSNKERYGTTTAEEEADNDGFLQQSRTKSNKSAQAGYQSRESAPQSSSKPANASVFFEDSNGKLVPYRGSETLRDDDGQVILKRNGQPLYTGLRSDGSPIAESHLRYLPNDDTDFYERTRQAESHPALTGAEIAANAGDKANPRFSDEEDQGTKGMLESLPSLGSRIEGAKNRWSQAGVTRDGVGDNWVFGRMERGGALVPLDLSGFQSELGQGGVIAGQRLAGAVADHLDRTGSEVPAATQLLWATSLAKEHNTDAATVLSAAGLAPEQAPAAQAQREPVRANSLGGRGRDALDRVYNSLGMHAGADAWELEGMVRSGDIGGAANALASTLPALTEVNGRFLRGASQDEKLNIVAEGLVAGLHDLHTTLQKHPQMAEQFGVGKGAGGFGIDAYIKSYVRDWVTVRSLQLDPTGQPTYQVPNDAFELIAHDAHKKGRSVLHELDDAISGSPNGLTAALKLDRLVSAAQSTKEGDPNTNATSFAQTVFSMPDPDLISTKLVDDAAGDVRLSFGTRRNYDATAGFFDRNPSEQLIDQRIEDYGTIGSRNATLQARIKGTDRAAPDAGERIAAAEQAQQWIDDNIGELERLKDDLNRGMVFSEGNTGTSFSYLPFGTSEADAQSIASRHGAVLRIGQRPTRDGGALQDHYVLHYPAGTPTSHGRGIVITNNERGAFLAGNTQGMNTSYREELVNDEDITPVDRAEDIAFETRLNNQLDLDEQAVDLGLVPHGGRSEADRTAAQFASQKLHFKNLGAGSQGAMAAGEAQAPLEALKRELLLSAEINAYRQRKQPTSGWQMPVNLPGPGDAGVQWSSRDEDYGGNPEDFSARNQQVIDLDRRTLHRSSWDGSPSVMPEGWHPSFSDPAIQLGVDGAPRAAVPRVGSTETAARHREALEARVEAGMGEGFRDDSRLGMNNERLQLDQDLKQGEVSGLGRRGSVFAQQPIAAAPVSMAHTLAAAGVPGVPAFTEEEAARARAGHLADYMDRLVEGGIRSSADGKRLIFKNQGQLTRAGYSPTPSEATVAGRVAGLRKRGII